MSRVFFSYSHVDEALRDRLETHLTMLNRNGLITQWHDRRILPGSDLDGAISDELERSDLVLLLVSPDFLASDYCYSVEMRRALERRAAGEADVVPIILRHCDWKNSPLAELSGLPPDNKPVVAHPDYDQAFLTITEGLTRLIKTRAGATAPTTQAPAPSPAPRMVSAGPRSSNLSIPREFSDLDRERFLDDGFEYVARFFENSLAELQQRDSSIESRFKRIDAQRFSASIFRNGTSLARCFIWTGGRMFGGNEIRYSNQDDSGSFNEMVTVNSDDHGLFFSSFGMQHWTGEREQKLTHEGAAELFWELLLRNLK